MTRCDVERGPQLPVRRQVASDGNMKLGGAHVGDLRKENRVEIDPTKPEEDGNLSGTNLSGCLAYMYKSLFLWSILVPCGTSRGLPRTIVTSRPAYCTVPNRIHGKPSPGLILRQVSARASLPETTQAVVEAANGNCT